MSYEDIIPEGLAGKTDEERAAIIKRWEYLHDLKRDILESKEPESQKRLSEIEEEMAQLSQLTTPRETVPESGVLMKEGQRYVLCPRCGTFVHVTPDRIDELAWELQEAPEGGEQANSYLIRSITCPVCKWGLGVPEEEPTT